MATGHTIGEAAHDDPDRAAIDAIAAYADHPSAFIACNDETSHYFAPGLPGVVPYRARGGTVLVFGGPFGPPGARERLLEHFRRDVVRRRRIVAVQVRPGDVEMFARQGFTVNQFGCTYGIDLSAFTSKGKPLAKVRQNVSRAAREGTTVHELPPGLRGDELDAIDRQWLRAKGWHVKKLDFMVGQREGRGAGARRLFVAERAGRITGYVSYSPAYGSRPGWLYDLTRRTPEASVGTIELVNLTALQQFKAEGAGWLHLGLTPFAGIGPDDHASGSGLVRWMIRTLSERGAFVYPAASQQAFKRKWAPHVIEPEYLAFGGGPRPSSVWQLLRVTNSI
ncbi:phosphatidylglycerol lysyltransferase domain-containing protein [Nocardia goodfellowii]